MKYLSSLSTDICAFIPSSVSTEYVRSRDPTKPTSTLPKQIRLPLTRSPVRTAPMHVLVD